MSDTHKPEIDYTIKIPLKQPGEQHGCQHCLTRNSCQFYIEIFLEHPRGWKNTINHRTETEFIGLLCKHFTS